MVDSNLGALRPADGTVLELVVTAREEPAKDVVAFSLASPDAIPLPRWEPGAHVDVFTGAGVVRQYSLCGDPADSHSWRIGVLLDPAGRGGSRWMHESLQVGDVVTVGGPRNHFSLEWARSYVFIAGGIGITPILPMIRRAEDLGADWRLHYGGRGRVSMGFTDELEAYGDRVTLWPEDECGLLPLADILGSPASSTPVYCCGPEPLLVAVEQACAGWPPGALHVERFASSGRLEASAGEDRGFEVVLDGLGVTVAVGADESILRALERRGINVLSSCHEGVCGTCETPVLEGVPDHRDVLLSEAERAANDTMMICVSRAKSERLILDI